MPSVTAVMHRAVHVYGGKRRLAHGGHRRHAPHAQHKDTDDVTDREAGCIGEEMRMLM
jgi:hypothetical protein